MRAEPNFGRILASITTAFDSQERGRGAAPPRPRFAAAGAILTALLLISAALTSTPAQAAPLSLMATFGDHVDRTKVQEPGSTEAERDLCAIASGDVCQPGTPGSGDDQFNEPTSLAINQSTGDVYVIDTVNERVERFDSAGRYLGQFDGSETPAKDFGLRIFSGIAVDNSAGPDAGDVYVADSENEVIDVFDAEGKFLRLIETPSFFPTGIAVDTAGNLWVASADNNAGVREYDSSGNQISSFPAEGQIGGLAVDSHDRVYLNLGFNTIYRFNSAGGEKTLIAHATVGFATSPAVDFTDDSVYVDTQIEKGAFDVAHLDSAANELEPFGSGDLHSRGGVAVAYGGPATGDVYVADATGNDVSIFGPALPLPIIGYAPPSDLTPTSATVTANLEPNGAGAITACNFEYVTEAAYESNFEHTGNGYSDLSSGGSVSCAPAIPPDYSAPTEVTADLTGLTPGIVYHYRVDATNEAGTRRGADQIFDLHSVAELRTAPPTGVEPDSAELTGSFVGNGLDTHYYFQWGTNTSYGSYAPLPPGEDAGSPGGPGTTEVNPVELGGLTPETTYHYRIVAENIFGITLGEDQEFTTPRAVANLLTGPATGLTPDSATLTGSFLGNGEDTHYYFRWGTGVSYGATIPLPPGEDAGSPAGPSGPLAVELTGLSPSTTYHYQVVATNGHGLTRGTDRTFTTSASAPSVRESLSDVHSDSALLHASIDPANQETTYQFEYGTAPCSIPASNCTSTPNRSVGGGVDEVPVEYQLGALQPSTTYYWRAVASNPTGTIDGPDRTFTTFPYGGARSDPCPNAHVRQQTGSALLLDCRAYELVSAADTGGYDVESSLNAGETPFGGYPQASDPPRVLYAVHDGGIPGTNHPTNRGLDPYLATRGENGWSTEYAGIPADNPFAAKPFSSTPSGTSSGLETFAFGGSEGCSPCFAGGYTGIPVRLPGGELIQGMVPAPGFNPGLAATPDGYIASDLSANGEQFIFGSTFQFAPGGNDKTGDVSIYDHNLRTGETHVVSDTPEGEGHPIPCLPVPDVCDAAHSDSNGISELDISKDGTHVLLGQKVATDADGNVYWHLYMNIGDSNKTIDLTPGATDGALFDGMTEDGSKVFFTTVDQLTTADTDHSADIYQAEVSGESAALTQVSTGSGGAGNSDSCDPAADSVQEHWNTVGPEANCGVVALGGGGESLRATAPSTSFRPSSSTAPHTASSTPPTSIHPIPVSPPISSPPWNRPGPTPIHRRLDTRLVAHLAHC